MEEIQKKLADLFEVIHDPILGIRDGIIIFANFAARRAFGNKLVGSLAADLVPVTTCHAGSDFNASSAIIRGKSVTITSTSFEGIVVMNIALPYEEKYSTLIPSFLLNSLNSSAMTMRLASDLVINSIGELPPAAVKHTEMLYHSFYSLLRITTNLDTVSKLATGNIPLQLRPWNINTICAELVQSTSVLIDGMGIELTFSATEHDILSVVDRDAMEQIILNLLANSIQKAVHGNKIALSLSRVDDRLIIGIDDNCGGVPPNVLGNIFTWFDRDAELSSLSEGVGFGLYIVRGLTECHGGTVMISGHEGGASVRVSIPITDTVDPQLHSPIFYPAGMPSVLRELSNVLGHELYNQKFLN